MSDWKIRSCRELTFSEQAAQSRLEKASGVFGEAVVKKIIGLALYWLGAKRSMIADLLGMPLESLRTFVRVIQRDGLVALEDRRRKHSAFLPVQEESPQPGEVCVLRSEDEFVVDFRGFTSSLSIPAKNKLQLRTVVLTLSAGGAMSTESAAKLLGISRPHAGVLIKSLIAEDVASLNDQREGQKKDYRVDDHAKEELLAQWALNAATGQSTSSGEISKCLQKRCGIEISDRTLRSHMKRLGLSALGQKVADLVREVKKGF